MTARSRAYNQNHDWDSREDFNSSMYDPQYPDDNVSGGVQLDHCRLYITNIPKALNDEGLRAAFNKFGTLVEVHVSKDPQKKYGLIKYETPGEAKLAMMKMNRTEPLKLNVTVAHKTKGSDEKRKADRRPDRPGANGERGRGVKDDGDVSVASRGRNPRKPEEVTNGGEMDDEAVDDDFGFSDTLDPNLHLELETIKLEQLKIREEQLMCKHRMILLKQADKKVSSHNTSKRCVLSDGKIIVRNVDTQNHRIMRWAPGSRDPDGSFGAAGDSNETTVCSCKKTRTWQCTDDGSSTPSTCVLNSEDREKSNTRKSEYSFKNVTSKATTTSKITKKSNYSKVTDTVSKKSDATSKKDVKRCKCRSEVTCDLKYSEFYSDSEDEDETNRLIQLRNADYMDIVEEELKLVISLAGYPKSKMRLKQMEQFRTSLADVIDMQLKAGLLKRIPSFLDYYLNRGALVCICKDSDTRDWIVRVLPGLQEKMCINLILLKPKVKRLCLAVLKIPRSCWPATAQDAFKLLQYFNPTLKTNLWMIYSQKVVNNVEITSFLIDRVSGEIIRGPNFKNVIDYDQMEFELTGYIEIYYEYLLSDLEEDMQSISSRVKLLQELRSAEVTPRNPSEVSVIRIKDVPIDGSEVSVKAIKDEPKEKPVQDEEIEREIKEPDDFRKELEISLQKDVLKKLKDVKYISDKNEVLVWSDETNYNENVKKHGQNKEQAVDNIIVSTSGVAVSDKTESFVESSDNLIARSSNLNIDSNRGIAYHRRTNYLHVENELKVAITLEGYPQNKLEGTHIRRLKHLFKEYLHKDMKMQRFSNLIVPKFQDIYLSNGAVIYVCDSLETKDYLTEILPKFINSTGLKLTFRDIKSLVRYTRIVMKLPKEHAHIESLDILRKLQSRYPALKPDCWKYYSDVAGKQKRQFGVDPVSLEVIKNPDFDPTFEGEKLIFRIIDRQKRDVSFEEVSKIDDNEARKHRDLLLKLMYVPIEPEIMAAPLARIRTNHYSDLIADDLKLYVGPSNYPESRIDEVLFHSIKRAFENIVIDSLEKGDLDDDTVPKLHDIYLFDGVIFIICLHMQSRLWIEQAIPSVNATLNISLKSTEFRGAVGIISMVVKTDKDTDEVISILQEKNPRLRTKYWRKISTVRTKSKLDVVLQIDKLSAQVINGPNFDKLIGSNAVQFKLGHLQSLLKPKSSLEELTKAYAKKKKSNELLEKSKKISMAPKDKNFNNLPRGSDESKNVQRNVISENERALCDVYESASASIQDELNDSKIFFYTGNYEELDQFTIKPESPKSFDNTFLLSYQQDYVKLSLKIPLSILPENQDDLNIIFDLLEDKNPGLNTELWQVFAESVYTNNGKFTVYVDKQSVAVMQGKHFDSKIGGEKLKFYF